MSKGGRRHISDALRRVLSSCLILCVLRFKGINRSAFTVWGIYLQNGRVPFPKIRVGVTKAPFVNFTVRKFLILQMYLLDFLIIFIFDRCRRTPAAVKPAKYEREIQWLTCFLTVLENSENNGTGEIGKVTPTHPWCSPSLSPTGMRLDIWICVRKHGLLQHIIADDVTMANEWYKPDFQLTMPYLPL